MSSETNPLQPDDIAPTMVPAERPSQTAGVPPVIDTADQTFATSWGAKAAAGQELTAGRRFGDYELLQEIGRGGMGVIFKARQVSLDRIVALKMILSGSYASGDAVERFKAEAKAAANLEHPGIVPIHEIGEIGGQHFFTMAFVDGGSLQQRLTAGPLTPEDAARTSRLVADALDHAHAHGIIHRDIKPHNILLQRKTQPDAGHSVSKSGTEKEDALANFEPKVSDFGLAKITQSESGMTASGETMGTPSYMPPEQASGRSREVGPRSDVYSLGAVLYCLLTGRPPFQAASAMETLRQVIEQEPVPPSQLNPSVPRDLETITLKCLQKEPARRYASAREMSDELGRYLEGQPILARPVGAAERAWRWCRRNRTLAGSLVAIFLALAAGAAVSSYFAVEANRRADESAEAHREADASAARAKESAAFAGEQSQLALQALNTLVVEVQDRLKDTPATAGLKRQLLESAMQGLNKLTQSADRARGADLSLAEARTRFGDVYQKLGNLALARAEYEAAVKIGEAVHDTNRASLEAREQLARSHAQLATLHLSGTSASEAGEHAASALGFAESLLKEEPERLAARRLLSQALDAMGRAALTRGDAATAQNYLRRRLETAEALARDGPTDVQAQLAAAAAHAGLGEALHKGGNDKSARIAMEKGVSQCRAIVAAKQKDVTAHQALANALSGLGDFHADSNRLDDASAPHTESRQLLEKIAFADPENASAKTALIRSYRRVGALSFKQNFRGLARDHYFKLLPMARSLLEIDPGNRQAQDDQLDAHEQLGRISRAWGAALGARNHFRDAYQLARELAASRPRDSAIQRSLFTVLLETGETSLELGDLPAARDEITRALELGAKLLESAKDAELTDRIGRGHLALANTLVRLDELKKADGAFERASELIHTPSLQELLTLYAGAGQAAVRTKDIARGLHHFQRFEKAVKKQFGDPPKDAQAIGMLAAAIAAQGVCKAQEEQFAEAARLLGTGLDLVRPHAAEKNAPPFWNPLIEKLGQTRQVYLLADKAIADLGLAASQPPPVARQLLLIRAEVLARQGKIAEASASAQRLKQFGPEDADVLFETVQAHALAAAAAKDVERAAQIELAVSALKEAVAKGFRNPSALRTELALESLRQDAGFKTVLRQVRELAQDPDRRLITNSIRMEFLFIPRGKFQMGAEDTPEQVLEEYNKVEKSEFKPEQFQAEHPRHEVEITRPFHMGAAEVTVAQFRAFVEATGYTTEAEREGTGGVGFNPNVEDAGAKKKGYSWKNPTFGLTSSRQPAVLISYNDALAFCRWLSQKEGFTYRLPTEAEWEYACRAGTQSRYWYGNDRTKLLDYANGPDLAYKTFFESFGNVVNYESLPANDGYANTSPAGEFLPNPWGLYDVHGNVWEWCQDGWDAKGYEKHAKLDPMIPPGPSGVIRGGCFM